MAAARDQAARMFRSEPDPAGSDDAARDAAALAEQLRAIFPMRPRVATPRRRQAPRSKSRRSKSRPRGRCAVCSRGRRRAEIGKAQAGPDRASSRCSRSPAAGYGVDYMLVGRFYVSTDDAYVRANNTTLGARVSGHIAAILPGDNAVVHTGEVIFRIDDGDYRIAVDAARTKIATQQATIDRIGRQVTAQESAVDQAKAQVVSAEAGLKRADLDFERQQTLSTKGFATHATFEVVRSRARPGRGGGEGGAGGL